MGFHPAVGCEVRCHAEGKQAEADGEGADDPTELDAALQHKEVEDAEDQHKHGCFREERRAATGGDNCQIEERGVGMGSFGAAFSCALRQRRNEGWACGLLSLGSVWYWKDIEVRV